MRCGAGSSPLPAGREVAGEQAGHPVSNRPPLSHAPGLPAGDHLEGSHSIRIVLVDDNVGFRQRLARLLAHERDFEIAGEAADGREAIMRARELRPDVILMDFRMTGMDGFTAARTISEEMPGIKIFILTAYPGALNRERVVKSGLEGLLIKDQPVSEIVAAIRKSVQP